MMDRKSEFQTAVIFRIRPPSSGRINGRNHTAYLPTYTVSRQYYPPTASDRQIGFKGRYRESRLFPTGDACIALKLT